MGHEMLNEWNQPRIPNYRSFDGVLFMYSKASKKNLLEGLGSDLDPL